MEGQLEKELDYPLLSHLQGYGGKLNKQVVDKFIIKIWIIILFESKIVFGKFYDFSVKAEARFLIYVELILSGLLDFKVLFTKNMQKIKI